MSNSVVTATAKSAHLGASLSIKQCRNFNVDDQKVLDYALNDLHIRRFRLMSYWDEIEKVQGIYDFGVLDAQIKKIASHKGQITLCLGVRQPRWPESHWPQWAVDLPKKVRDEHLLAFIRAVLQRYKNKLCIVSWQLENEALLKAFGRQGDFDRSRLRREFRMVKDLDSRPVIMTTSTSWGIPLRRPIPDIVGFSFYRITYDKGAYRKSIYQPWIFKLRAGLIKLLWRRPCFIHELQAEPWGPKNIWEMTSAEQAKSMDASLLRLNFKTATDTKLQPIDLWGLEWWYWLKNNGETEVPNTVSELFS